MVYEVNYGLLADKLDLDAIASGDIIVVRNYPKLQSYLMVAEKKFGIEQSLEPINGDTKRFDPIYWWMRSERDKGNLAALFVDFLKFYSLAGPLTQLELGRTRVVHPEGISGELGTPPAPPHRDLARPHYNKQFNIWFPFHECSQDSSLVLFPHSFNRTENRFSGITKNLDPNHDAAEIRLLTKTFSYSDFKLGLPLKTHLKPGDFILFNSEHYHCSPMNSQRTRISCDLRFVDFSFDDNSHYARNAFYYLENFKSRKGLTRIEMYRQFENYSKKKQHQVFRVFKEDLVCKILKAKKLKFKLSLIEKIALVLKFRSFYWLEKLVEEPSFVNRRMLFSSLLRGLIERKLKRLSDAFLRKHWSFEHNPVNYFKKGFHGFNQPVPLLYEVDLRNDVKEKGRIANQ